MLTGDLLAVRPGAAGEDGVAAPPVDPPSRDIPHPESRARRWRRVGASGFGSAAVHLALTFAFLWLWRGMWHDITAPEPIAVEIVHDVPGEAAPEAAPTKTAEKTAASSAPSAPEAPPPEPEPPKPEPQKPEPPKPEPPKPEPQPPEAQADPPPPDPTETLKEALRAGPVEPPPEAKAAATQSEINQTGNTATAPAKDTTSAAGTPDAPAAETPKPPPAAPAVLTTGSAETSVPASSPAPETETPPTKGDPTQSGKATAALAAALPMSAGLPMPSSFRAALSALGTSDNAAYRGSVFGALSRARAAVEQQARAAHLTGQVVLGIALKPDGSIDRVTVLQSSGHTDADAFAVSMVRRAAPFPPPPPGASRSFSPMIAFGES